MKNAIEKGMGDVFQPDGRHKKGSLHCSGDFSERTGVSDGGL